jgi:hypothetical protein
VQLELTLVSQTEAGPLPNLSDRRRYVAGQSFFDPEG